MLTAKVGMNIDIQSHHDGFNMPDPLLGFPARWLLEIGRQQHPEKVNQAESIANKAYPIFCVVRDLLLEKGYDKLLSFEVAAEKVHERFGKYKKERNCLIIFDATIGFDDVADFRPAINTFYRKKPERLNDINLHYFSFGNKLENKSMPDVKLQNTSDLKEILNLIQKEEYRLGLEKGNRKTNRRTMRIIVDDYLKNLSMD